MSYEADAHEVQMKILRYLLMNQNATFAQLRKDVDMQSDHFTFHLKKLEKVGYIEKQAAKWQLTVAGKQYANRMDTDENKIERQPKLSVVLIVQNKEGRYLTQERLKHPYYGYWGHPTGKIRWGETIEQAAARELLEETGLTATFRNLGIYHKLDYNDISGELLEDKYFVMMYGSDAQGKFIEHKEEHNNAWLSLEEFDKLEKKFGSVKDLRSFASQKHPVFKEHKFYYQPKDF